MSNNDKKTIDKETARIKQLLKDQEKEIDTEKKKYDQLLETFSNVKNNVAEAIKETLPEILKEALKGTNIGEDIKQLVTEKSGEVIAKLNEKIKGVGVEEEKNTLTNIQRNKSKNIDKPVNESVRKKSNNPNDINL
jgi:hypothetical protein